MYFQTKKYNSKFAISLQKYFLLFKNKCQIFCKFTCYPKILKNNPKILSMNPKIKKAPKTSKEMPKRFQQKPETLLNKNSPLSANFSFSVS